MKNILVTGGTVFVSKYVAEYFLNKGNNVYVLNRNTKPQVEGVNLIEGDRHNLGDKLKKYNFDVVLDITAYTKEDVEDLVNALYKVNQYVFISSSAVYPETLQQPFKEEQEVGPNSVWGDYGINKIGAEKYLLKNVPQAYILRPPYLYGQMENVYRASFIFDCANEDRTFCIPKDGTMPLQFFHVEDLCKLIEIILDKQPENHIFNVGNKDIVDINEWVSLCYKVAGKDLRTVNVDESHHQRSYFCFDDYGYVLDVSKQNELLLDTKPLIEGLKEEYEYYINNKEIVRKKPYVDYIDKKII